MKLVETYCKHDIHEVEVRGRTYYRSGDLTYSNLERLKQDLDKTGGNRNYKTTESSLPSTYTISLFE